MTFQKVNGFPLAEIMLLNTLMARPECFKLGNLCPHHSSGPYFGEVEKSTSPFYFFIFQDCKSNILVSTLTMMLTFSNFLL